MPSPRRSRERSQDKPQKPSRRRKSPNPAAANGDMKQGKKPAVRKRPLVELCERSGWSVQFLNRTPSAEEDLGDLCVRELIACREAGQLTLAIALADAALEAGLQNPRISANRTRALRAQSRGSQSSTKAAVASNGLRNRLKGLLFSKKTKTLPPTAVNPQAVAPQPSHPDVSKTLQALRRVCQSEGWKPQFFDASASTDVGLACAKEMQRCRLEGRHALVVALAAEAALQNVNHPRIQDNLNRSQAKAQLESLRAMVVGDSAGLLAAEGLLLDALIDSPGNQEYRQLLIECIGRQLDQQSGGTMKPELRQSILNLEMNKRLLQAVHRRRKDVADQS